MNDTKCLDIVIKRIGMNRISVYFENIPKANECITFLNLDESIFPLLEQFPHENLFQLNPLQREQYGKNLYQTILDLKLHEMLQQQIQESKLENSAILLRVRYPLHDEMLAHLQWELLHDGDGFLSENPGVAIVRLPIGISNFKCAPINCPLRITFVVNQNSPEESENEESELDAYLTALFPFLGQRTLEADVLPNPTNHQLAEYLLQNKIHVLWFAHNPTQSNESFNIEEFAESHMPFFSVRTVIVGGIHPEDENFGSRIIQTTDSFAKVHIPSVLLFPSKLTPQFVTEFFRTLLKDSSINASLEQAMILSPDEIIPILYLNDPNAVQGSVAPANHIQAIGSDDELRFWEKYHRPAMTVMKNHELFTLQEGLLNENESLALIWGKSGSGKSELINQFIIKYRSLFSIVLKYDWDDVFAPFRIISDIAVLLKKTDYYDAQLDSFKIAERFDEMEWLHQALNEIPVLLVLENIDFEKMESEDNEEENDLYIFIQWLNSTVRQNTKIILSSRKQALSGSLSRFIPVEMKPFRYEEMFSILLTIENKPNKLFLPEEKPANAGEGDIESNTQAMFEITRKKLADSPSTVKLLRYLSELLNRDEWAQKLNENTVEEIQNELFENFEKLLSTDVKDLILTCSLLPMPFDVGLLYYIYKNKSSNYEIISEYLDELRCSGVVQQEILQITHSGEKLGFKLLPAFKNYLDQKYQQELMNKQGAVAKIIADYYDSLSMENRLLWYLLNARTHYIRASNFKRAEEITRDIFLQLIETSHRSFALILIKQLFLDEDIKSAESLLAMLNSISPREPSPASTKLAKQLETWIQKAGSVTQKSVMLNKLALFYYESKEYDKALQQFEKSLKIAGEMKNTSLEYDTLIQIAQLYFQMENFTEAKAYYHRALEHEVSMADITVLTALGAIAYQERNHEEALNYYVDALAKAAADKNKNLQAEIFHKIGILHTDQQKLNDAIEQFQKSIKISQHLENVKSYSESLHELANAYFLKGDYKKAQEYYEKSLVISSEQGEIEDAAVSLHQLGMTCHALGEQQKALEKLNESLQISEKIKDDTGILDTNYQLGTIYLAIGEEQQALNHFQKCLEIAKENEDLKSESDALHEIAYIHHSKGEYVTARKEFETSLEISEMLHDDTRAAGTLHELARLYKELGDEEKARAFDERSRELFSKIDPQLQKV